ncbi:hypothetical protein P3X46_018454 [Hevea brasiliensis]|uniref:VQ domain-containing protein n=1 Tax=Hevea brasiliensis TaxID=3981 RepID=A0ABQ9LQT4_HEVBR|nr:uncharacterized protein LOC110661927 [Hevea brasiliensis]KAJ9170339.1 hypothetical protein P3X46_018454 [Hevea brasiliensis]
MDSGNSGSMQSSSGGDEEYDSRAESISAFLNSNNNPLSHVGPKPNPPPPPDHHHHHQHQHQHQTHSSSSSMFDPLSNYFDPLSSSRSPPQLTNPNSLLNLDMVWSKNIRSETNCTDLGAFLAPSSPTQQFFTNQPPSRTTFPSVQIPQGPECATRGSGSASASASVSNDQGTITTSSNNIVRNPKKRSRASRRAPTTVLTTDTTNFRAMVQEFTGIPAPPFTSSSFPRSRLDLFGTASTLRSAAHLEPPTPPYLLRPFAQKIQPPPPFLSSSSASTSFSTSSLVDAIASTTATNINSGTGTNITTSNSSTSINYQLSSDLGLLKQPQHLLNINMQNPILNLQSLLEPTPKYLLPNSAILGPSKTQEGSLEIPSNDSHLKMGVLEEFGLSHGHVSTNLTGLSNIVSSSNTTLRRSDNNHTANWGDEEGSNEGDRGLLRSINGNYSNSQQRVTNGKVNYSASSSNFKGPDNVAAARSEGMVESWICSSD